MRERVYWVDYIRAIACMLVVLLHTSAQYMYRVDSISVTSWNIGNFTNSFTHSAVPLFFMISGFLFFGNSKPRLKHFVRIATALLFYSACALFYLAFYQKQNIFPVVQGFFSKPVFYHLWFFYTLFSIYVLATIITVREVSFTSLLCLCFILFVLFNPDLSVLFGYFGITFKNYIHLDGNKIYYLLYAVFGACLGRCNLPKSTFFSFVLLSTFISVNIFKALLTYSASFSAGQYTGMYQSWTGVLVSAGAVSLFIFVRMNSNFFDLFKRQLLVVSRNSLPIYGIHAIVLDLILRQQYRNFDRPLIDLPVTFFVTLVVSLTAAAVIRRVDRYGWVS